MSEELQMRLVSYNILDGGEGRADPLAEVIEAQRPDVVALIEADNSDVIDRMTRRLKMDHVVGNGAKHSVALLSRLPVVDSINHAAIADGVPCFLQATVREGSVDWPIGVVHLSPGAREADESRRDSELAIVLKALDALRGRGTAHLLVGDFNASSPVQRIEPNRLHPRSREAWDEQGGQIPRRVVQRLLHAGYVDALHQFDAHAAQTTGTLTTQFPEQRADYIFAWGLAADRIRGARIERDRLAKYASDHFPVFAEIG